MIIYKSAIVFVYQFISRTLSTFKEAGFSLIYLKAERTSAVSNNKLKLFNIKWKDWKKYISINIK